MLLFLLLKSLFMEIGDKIIELTPNFWPELREKFKTNWPEHQIGHLLVDDYIKWVEICDLDTNYIKNVKIFTLNGDFSDGTFVVIVSEMLSLVKKK